MATYTYEFGSAASNLEFTIVYDDVTKQFTITVLTGALNVNALYWGDGDATAGEGSTTGFTGAKSESSLAMTGATTVWDDDGNATSVKEVWDGGMKIADAGLGKTPPDSYIVAGSTHSSFTIDAGTFDPTLFDNLGVRATSTSSPGGSIKWGDDTPVFHDDAPPPPQNLPPDAVDDDPACGVEGQYAQADWDVNGDGEVDKLDVAYVEGTGVPVSGNVLGNDSDPDGDAISVVAVNGVLLSTLIPDGDGWYEITLTDGTLKIQADGDYEFTYTGPNLAVGAEHWEGSFEYTISDGELTDTATVDLCIDAAAASHGYWSGGGHTFADSEGIAAAFGSVAAFAATSFDGYFGLDAPTDHTWSWKQGQTNTTAADLTFQQAISFAGNGVIVPAVDGTESDLVREATTAVLNFYDTVGGHDAFIESYEYLRGVDFADDAALLADLKLQVEGAFEGTGIYDVDEMSALLHLTHE